MRRGGDARSPPGNAAGAAQVVALKPALVSRYIRDLERLEAAVTENGPLSREAKHMVRELVTTVTVSSGETGPTIRIDGYLNNLLEPPARIRGGGSMVAEVRITR